ncbi:uncharacterized protein N7498_006099 [Penicillium cinerascens]|uniref:Rho GDP-dissociation inhibitor n=1 Tax=Penicillium cinerascens TaxID=70096 RepID=A0A9W9MHI7_9EURO|nr:uncharacterized protein N7498_006099 [Penicillium cinerascens]KAJ5201436.1 hypothetical protein N7498_006099 [Penicillium cinerascens]
MAEDKTKVVVSALVLEFSGHDEVTLDLSTPDSLKKLSENPVQIKEGVLYSMKFVFRVHDKVVTALRYLEETKRQGILIDRSDSFMGSYAPNIEGQPDFEVTFEDQEAPTGARACGRYDVTSKFVDEEGNNHHKFQWAYEITNDW